MKIILNIILFLFLVSSVWSQKIKEITHDDLFNSSSAQIAEGSAILKSNSVSLKIRQGQDYLMANRGFAWIAGDGSKCDDDTLRVLVIGVFGGKESFTYIDTLDLPIHEDSSNVGEFSFTLPEGDGLVNTIKLGYIPESEAAADTINFYSGVVLEYGLTVKITGVQVDDDTLAWDATKTEVSAKADSSTVIYWPDTIATVVTVSDTTVMSAQFATKISWSDTGATIVTVSDTTVMSARITGKADSGSVGYLAQNETITGNWINTDNPWADNEVVDALTVTGYQQDSDTSAFDATRTWVESSASIGAAQVADGSVSDAEYQWLDGQLTVTIILMAKEGWPSTTSGCAVLSQAETANKQNYQSLDFDPDTDEYAEWTTVMPLDWNAGTITANVIWYAATAHTVDKKAYFTVAGNSFTDNDAMNVAWGTAVSTGDNYRGVGKVLITPATGNITVSGAGAGEMAQFRLSRDADFAGDDYQGDARVLGLILNYTRI